MIMRAPHVVQAKTLAQFLRAIRWYGDDARD
jgi:hypothetical protein